MEQMNGETLFWLLALGVLAGLFTQAAMRPKGVGMKANLAGGGIGSLVCGVLAVQLGLPESLLFGLLGCLSILFLMNVFNVGGHHESGVQIKAGGDLVRPGNSDSAKV